MNYTDYLVGEEMIADFEIFRNLKTEEEKSKFTENCQERFNKKTESEKEQYLRDKELSLDKIENRAEELLAIVQLGEVADIVSLSYIAKKYFGKSKYWLYQRINGYNVNGKTARFKPDEMDTLRSALQDISRIVNETSLRLSC